MGMDVYGKKPKSEVGEYFRNNVWWWHPLWDFCVDNFPELAGKVKEGHSNSGDGLGARDSKALAKGIIELINNGQAQKYVDDRNHQLSMLPLNECDLCTGTGIRTDDVGISAGMPDKELSWEQQVLLGREKGTCNGCQGEGTTEAFELSYRIDVDNIERFAKFLADCGGFEIC